MSIIRISPLTIEDIKLLLELRMEVLSNVFEEERKSLSNKQWDEIKKQNEEYYKNHLCNLGHVACAAYVDGKLAGCGGICLYDEMPSPDNISGKCGYLMNIYVRKEFRRKGLARNICHFLIEKGKELGAEKIYLESSVMGVPLYSSIGFEDMHGYMKLA
ncbi:GNAT family N-acetyltransferase [Pseudobutyrivibrio sp.]|uniref:GNAT family N-acetyltransferase n=1 Tax=Pseudobutyrivibrio sp. TaxID=2014367 RepID=UPI001B53BDB2|nr:GNAT family N-acetyltransferase [Pseudobutyrivibrio sp.]MBP3263614.1 GNAT family N-acetyltransferase [Pseudobutyrivibrio sp.]